MFFKLAVKALRFKRPTIPFLKIYKNDISMKRKKMSFVEVIMKNQRKAPGLRVL